MITPSVSCIRANLGERTRPEASDGQKLAEGVKISALRLGWLRADGLASKAEFAIKIVLPFVELTLNKRHPSHAFLLTSEKGLARFPPPYSAETKQKDVWSLLSLRASDRDDVVLGTHKGCPYGFGLFVMSSVSRDISN